GQEGLPRDQDHSQGSAWQGRAVLRPLEARRPRQGLPRTLARTRQPLPRRPPDLVGGKCPAAAGITRPCRPRSAGPPPPPTTAAAAAASSSRLAPVALLRGGGGRRRPPPPAAAAAAAHRRPPPRRRRLPGGPVAVLRAG